MKSIIRYFFIVVFSLWALQQIVPGITISGGILPLLYTALLFVGLHFLVKPVLKILLLPITFMTLGLSTLFINGFLLYILDYFVDTMLVNRWTLESIGWNGYMLPEISFGIIATYIIGAFVLSVLTGVLRWL